jgi:hypothetical protein
LTILNSISLRLLVFIASLMAAACTALPSTARTAVTTDVRCDSAEVRATFDAFLIAFNRGDRPKLAALFAPSPAFRWYAVAPPFGRTGTKSQNRATLMTYFRGRHAKREILKVVRFRFASTQSRDGALMANFNGELTRKASDLRPERRGFKATIVCGAMNTSFIVVSIGTKI